MQVETRLANIGKKPRIALEIDAVGAIVDLVDQGLGQAIVTLNALLIARAAPALSPRRIVSPRMTSVLALATSAERPRTPLARATAALTRRPVQSRGGEASARQSETWVSPKHANK